jgi:hypothetical protein
MAKNFITGYDVNLDECGQYHCKSEPTLKTATINVERVQELIFNHNNSVVKLMY